MDCRSQLGRNITALLLFAAIMLPTTVDFLHIFDSHEHTFCTEKTVHFHEAVVKCDVCDHQLSSSNFDVVQYPDFFTIHTPSTQESSYLTLRFFSHNITNTQLRAPPMNS